MAVSGALRKAKESKKMANNDDGGTFMVGFLLGGIIGTIVGILLAPKAGSDTRAELAGQSEIWRDRAEEIAARVRERVGPAIEGVRERVVPAVDIMREGVAPGADAINNRGVDIGTGVTAVDSGLEVDGGTVAGGGLTVDGAAAEKIDAGETESPSSEKPA